MKGTKREHGYEEIIGSKDLDGYIRILESTHKSPVTICGAGGGSSPATYTSGSAGGARSPEKFWEEGFITRPDTVFTSASEFAKPKSAPEEVLKAMEKLAKERVEKEFEAEFISDYREAKASPFAAPKDKPMITNSEEVGSW